MAVTFTISGLIRDTTGSRRRHSGLITCSGTTTDNGDAITAAQLGLHVIEDLNLDAAGDSASNPEAAFVVRWEKTLGTISFYSQATAGATTPLAAITDGTSVTGYLIRFEAYGN